MTQPVSLHAKGCREKNDYLFFLFVGIRLIRMGCNAESRTCQPLARIKKAQVTCHLFVVLVGVELDGTGFCLWNGMDWNGKPNT